MQVIIRLRAFFPVVCSAPERALNTRHADSPLHRSLSVSSFTAGGEHFVQTRHFPLTRRRKKWVSLWRSSLVSERRTRKWREQTVVCLKSLCVTFLWKRCEHLKKDLNAPTSATVCFRGARVSHDSVQRACLCATLYSHAQNVKEIKRKETAWALWCTDNRGGECKK